jgi:GntR family transcriptional regulator, transcriptional repressor for pyruvate dehydrogenase complex
MIRSAPIRRSDSQAQLILDMIDRGKLHIGDRLPGQRELSEKLNIGRSTLREAIRYLEALGVLETRLGLGTYVVRTSHYSFETPLSSWLQENRDKVIKIFEVREALESKSAELAAINASNEDIQAMEVVLAEMREAVDQHDLKKVSDLDYQFHNLIGISAKNDLLHQILYNVRDLLRDTREAILAMPGRSARSLEEHTAVLKAIKSRSPEQAKEMMVHHLSNAVSDISE